MVQIFKKCLRRLAVIALSDHDKRSQFYMRAELLKQSISLNPQMGTTDEKIADKEVVVSLTTYGKRLYDVYLTIETIMRGTIKPNRIVLWLQEDMKALGLPISLQTQMKRGLEVYYTKDIRSYKKLIPSLRKYPESIIITIDDDVLYEPDVVENLLSAYKKDSTHVYGSRLRKIVLDKNRQPLSYYKWMPITNGADPSPLNMCIGVGGVLYPPHCFSDEVFNEEAFMKYCPCADDIWFWFMANKNGFTEAKSFTHDNRGTDFLTNPDVQDVGLKVKNMGNGGENDKQLLNLFNKYGNSLF